MPPGGVQGDGCVWPFPSSYSDERTRIRDYPFHPLPCTFQVPTRGCRLLWSSRRPPSGSASAWFFQALSLIFQRVSQTWIALTRNFRALWGFSCLLDFLGLEQMWSPEEQGELHLRSGSSVSIGMTWEKSLGPLGPQFSSVPRGS